MSDTDKQERRDVQAPSYDELSELWANERAKVAQLEADLDRTRETSDGLYLGLQSTLRERDEARAHIEKLEARIDAMLEGDKVFHSRIEKLEADKRGDEADYVLLLNERTAARAEVERLRTALRHGLTRCVQGMHEAAQAEMSRALTTQEDR